MRKAIININICKNCTECAVEIICPKHALFRESLDDNIYIDSYRCSGCMECTIKCPNNAIEIITQPCNGKPGIGW